MSAKSGKDGSCTINAVSCSITDWEFNPKANLVDCTDSGTTADYEAHLVGRKSGSFNLKGHVDLTGTPQLTTLAVGTVLSTINLIANGTKKYAIASATVETLRATTPIASGDPVGFDVTVKVNGAWTEFA